MSWTVTYRPSAERDLTNLWSEASDQQAIPEAPDAIDRQLSADPLAAGESRQENTHILVEMPLAVLFDVLEDGRIVSNWAVFRWEQEPAS